MSSGPSLLKTDPSDEDSIVTSAAAAASKQLGATKMTLNHFRSERSSAAGRTTRVSLGDADPGHRGPIKPSTAIDAPGELPPSSGPFRPDIQGLRAVAVGAVVLFHAGLPWITGGYIGVDVFFVVSGYLISSHLLVEMKRTGRISLSKFYARRIRRILPVSFIVLSVTLIASFWFLPPLRLTETVHDAVATALYAPNLLFAWNGTQYLAETDPSPFQHYWSLGVEEQFYIIWPAMLWAAWRVTKTRLRPLAWVIVGLVVASLGLSIFTTSVAQPLAFFLLPTRAWELGVGGLIAVWAIGKQRRVSDVIAKVGILAGLFMIAASIVVLGSGTSFPGFAAILPVFGTALVILFGPGPSEGALGRAMRSKPVQYLGRISYSVYLWHWPLLVLPAAALGHTLSLPASLGLSATSMLLGALSYRLIEQPVRVRSFRVKGSARRTIALALAGSALLTGSAIGTGQILEARPLSIARAAVQFAATKTPTFTPFVPSNLVPGLRQAADDNPDVYSDGCHLDVYHETPPSCVFGDVAATTSYVLFGDSHAAQWFPGLNRWAKSAGVRLVTFTKSSCPAATVTTWASGNTYSGCDRWRQRVLSEIASIRPGVVVMSYFNGTPLADGASDPQSEYLSGLSTTLASLPKSSIPVLIADTPLYPDSPSVCLSVHLDSAASCLTSRRSAVDIGLIAKERSVLAPAGGAVVDMSDYFCSATECGPIIGNVLLFRDRQHLTATASSDMASALGQSISTSAQSAKR